MQNLVNKLLAKTAPITKAVSAGIALLVPFVTVLVSVLADGKITGAGEWLAVASAAGALIGGTTAVYHFPNTEPTGR